MTTFVDVHCNILVNQNDCRISEREQYGVTTAVLLQLILKEMGKGGL